MNRMITLDLNVHSAVPSTEEANAPGKPIAAHSTEMSSNTIFRLHVAFEPFHQRFLVGAVVFLEESIHEHERYLQSKICG